MLSLAPTPPLHPHPATMFHHSATYCTDPTTTTNIPAAAAAVATAEINHNYYSSLPPPYYFHRSSSTHSLPSPIPDATTNTTLSSFYSSPSSGDFHDFPVRRVFSTGDLQGMNGLPASNDENCAIGGRAIRYTAEERREKIERYRSKRNHRNFQKKITYACRKTLADGRPRIRGRFARNGEMEAEMAEVSGFDCSSSSSNNNNYDGEYWLRQMQAALGMTEGDAAAGSGGYDEEFVASFVDVFSMDLLS